MTPPIDSPGFSSWLDFKNYITKKLTLIKSHSVISVRTLVACVAPKQQAYFISDSRLIESLLLHLIL